jgi:FkbM family methyltransferase
MKLSKIFNCLINISYLNCYFHGVSPLFESKKFFKNIKKAKTLLDVGSNKGQFILITRKYLPSIKVFSFEPQVDALKIQKKILGKKNIFYYPIALGSKNKDKFFYITKRNDSSSLLKPKTKIHNDYAIIKKLKIKVKKFNDILNVNALKKPILLKLDVQGFELEVLKGFEKKLNLVEYSKAVNAAKLIEYLEKYNFRIIDKLNQTKINGKIYQEDILFKKSVDEKNKNN